jgi:radical SAM superfamily enzyme YgiQ (UPF0313 family)
LEKEQIRGDKKSLIWRSYSVKRAKLEIDNILKHSEDCLKSPNIVYLFDPIFGLNLTWREKVLDYLVEKRFDYNFLGETRIDTFNKKQLDLFKKAKFYNLIGLESGSLETLKRMRKTKNPNTFLDKMRKFLLYSKEINYEPLTLTILLNFPGDDKQSFQDTFDFLNSLVDKGVYFKPIDNFYNFFPGDDIYYNLDYWETTYGTKIYYKSWWKSEETYQYYDFLDASGVFRLQDALPFYKDEINSLYKSIMSIIPTNFNKIALLRTLKEKDEIINKNLGILNNLDL